MTDYDVLTDPVVSAQLLDDDPATVAVLRVALDGSREVWHVNTDMALDPAEALTRFDRYAEHGPEPDGWMVSAHGLGHLLYLRLRQFPAL